MATLQVRIENLATRIATECKSLRSMINANQTDLSSLTTANKTNLVAALNELKSTIDGMSSSAGAAIDDSLNASTTKTWSITKISDSITAALNTLLAGAPAALDTLDELAEALGNDANYAASTSTALGNRVRVDISTQGLSTQQKQNARTNIDAYGSVELGNPDTNFVTAFNTGLA